MKNITLKVIPRLRLFNIFDSLPAENVASIRNMSKLCDALELTPELKEKHGYRPLSIPEKVERGYVHSESGAPVGRKMEEPTLKLEETSRVTLDDERADFLLEWLGKDENMKFMRQSDYRWIPSVMEELRAEPMPDPTKIPEKNGKNK